jgi:acetoacetyl-CoA reductase
MTDTPAPAPENKKRTAVVTGGNRGLGAAAGKALLAAGHNVVAIYIGRVDEAHAFKKETGIDVYKCDVSHFAEVQEVFSAIDKKYGGIDILVNNAGITRDGFLHKMERAQWDAVINVNLSSSFNTCRAVVPGMRDRKWGRIINISSINGQKGQFGQTNYSAAKAGILGFTKALAQENANKGVTVNAVCPGYIMTEMTGAMQPEILESIRQGIPMGHLGEPADIGDMIAYIASDKAKFITGATFSVNGGQHMA